MDHWPHYSQCLHYLYCPVLFLFSRDAVRMSSDLQFKVTILEGL